MRIIDNQFSMYIFVNLRRNHVNSAVPPNSLKHKEISGGGVGGGVVSTPPLRFLPGGVSFSLPGLRNFVMKRWKIAFPGILKIFEEVSLDTFLAADCEIPAEDAKVAEERTKLESRFPCPGTPRPLFHTDEQRQQVASQQVFRIIFHVEPGADIREHLDGVTPIAQLKDSGDGSASFFRP